MSEPRVRNAADEGQVRKAERKAKDLQRQQRDDLLSVLALPQGRRFVWDLLSHCGIYKDSFTGNSLTFYNEGRRSVGLYLLGRIENARPEAILEMMLAAQKEASADQPIEKED